MMGPVEAVGSVYSRYFQFSGRASRAEYWWTVLFNSIVLLVLVALDVWLVMQIPGVLENPRLIDPFSMFSLYFWAVSFIPMLAVTVRRLHDGGFSGFWILLYLIPPVCAVVQLVAYFVAIATGNTMLVVIVQGISLLSSVAILVLLLWPSERDDNIHGAPWRPTGSGKPRVQNDGTIRHDAMQGYAVLFEQDRVKSPGEIAAREAARKSEVRSLYEQRVLGRSSQA